MRHSRLRRRDHGPFAFTLAILALASIAPYVKLVYELKAFTRKSGPMCLRESISKYRTVKGRKNRAFDHEIQKKALIGMCQISKGALFTSPV
jgi:hypothetical protein